MSPQARSGPGWISRLALICGGLLVGLLAAEILVRALAPPPEVAVLELGRFRLSQNPRLGYEPIPGTRHQGGRLGIYAYRGTSNRLGFRGPDPPDPSSPPRPGAWRLVLLGDSLAEGMGLEDFSHTLPAQLGDTLGEAGEDVEVINLAVSGYNTLQEVETLRRHGLAFRPRVVVVAYCLNDRRRSDGRILARLLAARAAAGTEAAQPLPPVLAWSALYRKLAFADAAENESPPTPQDPFPGDTRAEAFDLLAELSADHGFDVVIAVFPRLARLDPYPFHEDHAEVTALAQARGFEVLDLLPTFQACARERGSLASLRLDRWHPSAAGHRCAAEALARRLVQAEGVGDPGEQSPQRRGT